VEKASVVIVVLAKPADSQKRYGADSAYYIQDCAAATQNMLLIAHGLSLGAVWIGAFSKEAVRKTLEIESQYEVFALVCLGHYQGADKVTFDGYEIANNEKRQRKRLEKIAFVESLETPWTD